MLYLLHFYDFHLLHRLIFLIRLILKSIVQDLECISKGGHNWLISARCNLSELWDDSGCKKPEGPDDLLLRRNSAVGCDLIEAIGITVVIMVVVVGEPPSRVKVLRTTDHRERGIDDLLMCLPDSGTDSGGRRQ